MILYCLSKTFPLDILCLALFVLSCCDRSCSNVAVLVETARKAGLRSGFIPGIRLRL